MYCNLVEFFFVRLTPSVSAQGPALELTPATEGIISLRMKPNNFYISGDSWYMFHIAHRWASFEDFWLHRERAYNHRNAQPKQFFLEFQLDPEKHAKILADRALRHKIKQILNTDVPYKPAEGLLEPKPEPLDEAPSPSGFMYWVIDDLLQDD